MAGGKKNARRRGALIIFQDESGCSQLPVVRATWAPKGQTPVLTHRFSWKRVSMSAAAVYEPDGSDAFLVFGTRPGSYNEFSLIEFLTDLHTELPGRKVTLIWDGLPSHRSRAMAAWLRRQRRWLVVEPLPGYAPDLNPVEGIWGNLKGRELANLCADQVGEVEQAAIAGLDRIGTDAELCFALLRHCGLSL